MDYGRLGKALTQRWNALKARVLLLLVLSMSCYALYRLDESKRGFDEAKGNPVLIDSGLKSKIQSYAGDDRWNKIKDFVPIDQQSRKDDLVNRTIERMGRDSAIEMQIATRVLNTCVDNALKAPQNQPSPQGSTNKSTKSSHHFGSNLGKSAKEAGSQPSEPKKTPGECLQEYRNIQRDIDTKAEDRIATAYEALKDIDLQKLKAGETASGDRAKYSRATSFLDESSDLHILYQILRIAILVLIVFALIVIFGLLLSAVMLSDGLKVFSDRTTSLIEAGRRTGLPAARVAVLSAAALGVGTAVGAGALAPPASAEDGSGSVAGHGPGGSPGPYKPNPNPPPRRDIWNNKYDFSIGDTTYGGSTYGGNITNYGDDNSVHSNPAGPPKVEVYPQIELKPQINVFPKATPSPSPPGPVTLSPDLEKKVDKLLEAFGQAHTDLDKRINATKIENLQVSNPKKDSGDASQTKEPLLIDFLDTRNIVREPLDLLKQQIENNRTLAQTLPVAPVVGRRSTLGRIFKGNDKYLLSYTAVQSITRAIQTLNERYKLLGLTSQDRIEEEQLDQRIIALITIVYAKGGEPASEEEFWKRLQDELQPLVDLLIKKDEPQKSSATGTAPDTEKKKADLKKRLPERLNFWRDTILMYARRN